MTRAKPCTCPAFPYEHERYGEECIAWPFDDTTEQDWRLDDVRRGQSEWINSQR